jgi:hypothetical protein
LVSAKNPYGISKGSTKAYYHLIGDFISKYPGNKAAPSASRLGLADPSTLTDYNLAEWFKGYFMEGKAPGTLKKVQACIRILLNGAGLSPIDWTDAKKILIALLCTRLIQFCHN